MCRFGADKILSADSLDGGLSDADLDRLIDRTGKSDANAGGTSGCDDKMQTDCKVTHAIFAEIQCLAL